MNKKNLNINQLLDLAQKALKLKMDSNLCLTGIGEVLLRQGNYTEGLAKLKAGEGSINFDLNDGLSIM